MLFAILAPVFILFDMLQLLLAERYIGIKQIRAGKHPSALDKTGPTWLAAIWLAGVSLYLVYMLAMLMEPSSALQGLIMLAVTLIGFSLRRTLGLKFALVILTIEAATRMGLLVNLMVSVFLWQGQYVPPGWRPG